MAKHRIFVARLTPAKRFKWFHGTVTRESWPFVWLYRSIDRRHYVRKHRLSPNNFLGLSTPLVFRRVASRPVLMLRARLGRLKEMHLAICTLYFFYSNCGISSKTKYLIHSCKKSVKSCQLSVTRRALWVPLAVSYFNCSTLLLLCAVFSPRLVNSSAERERCQTNSTLASISVLNVSFSKASEAAS